MAKRGIFISFEGIDGAGKSSHIAALSNLLQRGGNIVTVTREPGGTPLAEQLRELVLNQPMDGLTEAMLVFAARRDHVVRAIAPALQRGETVLSDRFTDSSFAYQGGGQGLPLAVLQQLEQWVQGDPAPVDTSPGNAHLLQPDLTLWFDLPPVQAAARLELVRSPDRFEVQGEEFFTRVRAAYAARAAAAPHRFVCIDAARARSHVWSQVESAVRARGWLP